MIGIKHFRDGNRLVVVFEDFFKNKDINDDDIIKNYLSVIAGEYTTCSPANVKPIQEDGCNYPELPVVFEDGPFKGRTPMDVFMGIGNATDEKAVFTSFPEKLEDIYTENEVSCIKTAMSVYLQKKFIKTDANEYESRLSDNQKKLFYSIYAPAISDKNKTISTLIKEWKEY